MIDTGIVLAAGEGTRLRGVAPLKPLCNVAGRPLLDHAIHGLARAGLRRAVIVIGYGADRMAAHIAKGAWPILVETVTAEDYRRPNGASLLAAEHSVAGGEALLAMCDHLVDPALYAHVAQAGTGGGARLGIDRRIASDWVDLDDVTRVETDGERIVAIGKGLARYDCFDTGVFAIGDSLFAALHTLDAPSLTEGMRILAAQHRAFTVDCSTFDWIDVDDAPALEKAERWKKAA